MTPTILALQHSPTEPLGILGDALREAGLEARYIRGFDGQPVPQELGDALGLIVLGGPMSAYEQARFPFLTDEMRLIGQALERGRPVLGLCLGSQMLAHVLGGDVRKNAQPEIGWHTVTLTEAAAGDGLFRDFPPNFMGFHWHGDIFSPPPDAVPMAHSALTPCQAFRHGDMAYGIQFHMEVTENVIRDWTADGTSELADAGLAPASVLDGVSLFLPDQQRLGHLAFQNWANKTLAATA